MLGCSLSIKGYFPVSRLRLPPDLCIHPAQQWLKKSQEFLTSQELRQQLSILEGNRAGVDLIAHTSHSLNVRTQVVLTHLGVLGSLHDLGLLGSP